MRDWKEETQKIITWMRTKVEEAKAQGLVLGMSGGIDSSVVAVLAQKALGEKSLGIMMPCYSIPQDLEDALKVAQMFSIPKVSLNLPMLFLGFPGSRSLALQFYLGCLLLLLPTINYLSAALPIAKTVLHQLRMRVDLPLPLTKPRID